MEKCVLMYLGKYLVNWLYLNANLVGNVVQPTINKLGHLGTTSRERCVDVTNPNDLNVCRWSCHSNEDINEKKSLFFLIA